MFLEDKLNLSVNKNTRDSLLNPFVFDVSLQEMRDTAITNPQNCSIGIKDGEHIEFEASDDDELRLTFSE